MDIKNDREMKDKFKKKRISPKKEKSVEKNVKKPTEVLLKDSKIV